MAAAAAADDGPLYLGFDLSTQQLKAIVVGPDLKAVARAHVDFDADFGPAYGISKGVHHGSVYWNDAAEARLAALDPARPLREQLAPALAHPWSPNWQDQSTQAECDAFDAALGGRERLAHVTGSGAHHIMRLRRVHPDVYASTARISLVSSFLASVLVGHIAPLDTGDVCGMNLWDMEQQCWSPALLSLAAGGDAAAAHLRRMLGEPCLDGGQPLGRVAGYFAARYGFRTDCQVLPFTGDNPATLLALPLRPGDAIVSLGTSTTFLMHATARAPDGAYHFFNHPTTPGHYMFMLCYKNGGLARERVRDALPGASGGGDWAAFDKAVVDTPPLGQDSGGEEGRAKMGLYFDLRETVPNIRAGTWRFTCAAADGSDLREEDAAVAGARGWSAAVDARLIVESQALSMRLRAQKLLRGDDDRLLPAQPRRIYLVGGASHNAAIAATLGSVLGGTDGVYRLDVGGDACALGGAYKALWALERRGPDQTFDDLLAARWQEEGAIEKVDVGYRKGTYEKYGNVLGAFEEMESRLLAEEKQ
ncbi:D-xylulose kinase [Cordyceps militaris CM01]|uniref:Xylulose kinase n=1 Tax=Cordyceps militaris (strain CM01) TaxID=983644 RepID=G3JQ40_CORMM|nr:D-xylulose kinase [Cordyceps militaris CM01]EGX89291.1 D-xylulose kinase [Cordyceps militaris CM01]